MNRPPLTERQQQIFDTIRSFRTENGCSPTVKEIGERVGIRSTNGVSKQLDTMERKGYLRRTTNRARSIQLVEQEQALELPVRLPFVSSFTGVTARTIREAASSYLAVDRSFLGRAEPSACFIGSVGDDGMRHAGIRVADLVVVEERTLSRIAPQSLTACLSGARLIVRRMIRMNRLVHLVPEESGYRTELAGDGEAIQVLGVVRAVVRPVR